MSGIGLGDRVPGDRATKAKELKTGDKIRLYDGIRDTAVIAKIEKDIRQGGRYVYSVILDTGEIFERMADETLDIALGPERKTHWFYK
jgi:hypothetical protein